MNDIYLQVDNIHFSYESGKEIIHEISFQAKRDESIGIIGANGVGKSTLLKLLVGLLFPSSGSICVDGLTLEKKNLKEIRQKIGYVFQDSDSQLFMTNVYDEIAFGPRNYGYSKDEVDKRAQQALEMTHIEHISHKPIYTLSGGEKKLVSISCVLSMHPEIILMDEPSAALDPKNRRNLIHILNELKQVKLISSHDLDFIWDTCNKVILINHGKIIASGNTKDILMNKQLLEENGLELPLRLQ